jgi:hypothetical protein
MRLSRFETLFAESKLSRSDFSKFSGAPKGSVDSWFSLGKFPEWTISWLNLYLDNMELRNTLGKLNITIEMITGQKPQIEITSRLQILQENSNNERSRRAPNVFPELLKQNVIQLGDRLKFIDRDEWATVTKNAKVIWDRDSNFYSVSDLAQIILDTKSLQGTLYWVHELSGKTLLELSKNSSPNLLSTIELTNSSPVEFTVNDKTISCSSWRDLTVKFLKTIIEPDLVMIDNLINHFQDQSFSFLSQKQSEKSSEIFPDLWVNWNLSANDTRKYLRKVCEYLDINSRDIHLNILFEK